MTAWWSKKSGGHSLIFLSGVTSSMILKSSHGSNTSLWVSSIPLSTTMFVFGVSLFSVKFLFLRIVERINPTQENLLSLYEKIVWEFIRLELRLSLLLIDPLFLACLNVYLPMTVHSNLVSTSHWNVLCLFIEYPLLRIIKFHLIHIYDIFIVINYYFIVSEVVYICNMVESSNIIYILYSVLISQLHSKEFFDIFDGIVELLTCNHRKHLV